MRWNCPHCSEIVSIGIDIEQVKRAYVRCGACQGVALLQTKSAFADHEAARLAAIQMKERQLEIQAAQLQAEKIRTEQIAKLAAAHAAETETAVEAKATAETMTAETASARTFEAAPVPTPSLEAAPTIMPPPFTHSVQSHAMDIAREIDREIENTIRSLAALDQRSGNRKILRATSFSQERSLEMAIEQTNEETPTEIDVTEITVTELSPTTEVAREEPVVPTPVSAAALTDHAGAIARFDHSNPAIQTTAATPTKSAQPPAFLMRKENIVPMPIQFAVNEIRSEPAENEGNQKTLKFAVFVAAVVAIVSGIYLYQQGQKLLQADETPNSVSVSVSGN